MKYIEANLFEGIIENYSDKITLIPHICNNVKKWGAGFVLPLARHFPEARASFFNVDDPKLGETSLVQAKNVPVIIANMFAQDGIGIKNGIPPIRYEALQKCMNTIQLLCIQLQKEGKKVTIACPMFGAGLAGGDWNVISEMIFKTWSEKNIDTEIYFIPELLPKNLRVINIGVKSDDVELRIVPR